MEHYIEIPPQLVEPLLEHAAETGLSVEEIVESAIKNYSERSKYFYFDSFKMNIISTDTEAQSKNFNGVYHTWKG